MSVLDRVREARRIRAVSRSLTLSHSTAHRPTFLLARPWGLSRPRHPPHMQLRPLQHTAVGGRLLDVRHIFLWIFSITKDLYFIYLNLFWGSLS